MKIAILAVLVLAALGLAYIRLAPDDVAEWHVDPLTVTPVTDPNRFLLRDGDGDADSPVFAMEASDLAREFEELALAQPRVTRLAGAPEDLWMTYVQRSKWFGFPDYISVRIFPVDAGRSAAAIYSRARYGRSDLGVNKARITDWVAALRRIEAARAAAK